MFPVETELLKLEWVSAAFDTTVMVLNDPKDPIGESYKLQELQPKKYCQLFPEPLNKPWLDDVSFLPAFYYKPKVAL